jgi:uncharacterized protein YecT (DUF1311 family)
MKQKLVRWITSGALLTFASIAYGVLGQASQIDGNWKITWNEALGASDKLEYFSDDPRLSGQLVSFSASRIYDRIVGVENCKDPHIHPVKASLLEMIAGHFSVRNGFSSESAEIALRLLDDWEVDDAKIYRISCGDTPWHATHDQKVSWGDWLALSNDKRMMIPGPGNTILLLSKLPKYSIPNPSFACTSARSRTEKAICASYSLSVLDRNIADALTPLRANKEGNGEDVRVVQADHSAWLHRRDRCGADSECLQRVMEARLALLVTQLREYRR